MHYQARICLPRKVGELPGEARLSQQVLVVLEGHHDDLGDVVVRHGDGFGAGGEDAFADGAEVPRGLGGGDGPHGGSFLAQLVTRDVA
jgi:hypothetical protein